MVFKRIPEASKVTTSVIKCLRNFWVWNIRIEYQNVIENGVSVNLAHIFFYMGGTVRHALWHVNPKFLIELQTG